jgi:alpha-beta hydrolase superfamily lysophospholipase
LLLAILPPLAMHVYIFRKYMPFLVRAIQETPPFNIPYGQPQADAEAVTFPTTDNLMLQGCYLRARTPVRRGVILFGLEYGSKRWACAPYCDFLRENGYDVFTFEPRGQGESPCHPGFTPMVWTTEFELADFRAAVAYMKKRPDADPAGIGFYGLSKGGSAGLFIACEDPYIRCCVTDGMFGMHTTMVPYMKKYIFIYSRKPWLARNLPGWYYEFAARVGRKRMGQERNCKFANLEKMLPRLSPRPLLMIHGRADTYIRPEMAEKLFSLVREPKELWIVEDAKHNQAFHVASGGYKERILGFFEKNLAAMPHAATGADQHGVARASTAVVAPREATLAI